MAKVLNGEVWAGDKIAYATSGYNKHPNINVGTVIEVAEKPRKRGGTVTKLKVQVEHSSTWTDTPRIAWIEARRDRVVKL